MSFSSRTRARRLLRSSETALLSAALAIPAIPVTLNENGSLTTGAITHLTRDAHLEYAGDGFNPSTVRVKCDGSHYIVFRIDIEGFQFTEPTLTAPSEIAKTTLQYRCASPRILIRGLTIADIIAQRLVLQNGHLGRISTVKSDPYVEE